MGFSDDVKSLVAQAREGTDNIIREVAVMVIRNVVMMSPVGNPDIWKVNRDAALYNEAVSDHNRELRNDPGNLTKSGSLRRGLKVNDSMDIKKPKGYRGGRFRGNWQVSIGAAVNTETGVIDPSGNDTIAKATDVIMSFKVGQAKFIWFCNNVPYAVPLEYGHSTQAPNGMVRITAMQLNDILESAVIRVRKNK